MDRALKLIWILASERAVNLEEEYMVAKLVKKSRRRVPEENGQHLEVAFVAAREEASEAEEDVRVDSEADSEEEADQGRNKETPSPRVSIECTDVSAVVHRKRLEDDQFNLMSNC